GVTMSLFEQTNTFAGAAVGRLDGGRATAAAALARGTARLLRALGFSTLSELPLASGRRADLVGLGADGEIVIVEVKSSVAVFRAAGNGSGSAGLCGGLSSQGAWGVRRVFFPRAGGLTAADGWGAETERTARDPRPPPATRRSMTLRFARAAAGRLELLGKGE